MTDVEDIEIAKWVPPAAASEAKRLWKIHTDKKFRDRLQKLCGSNSETMKDVWSGNLDGHDAALMNAMFRAPDWLAFSRRFVRRPHRSRNRSVPESEARDDRQLRNEFMEPAHIFGLIQILSETMKQHQLEAPDAWDRFDCGQPSRFEDAQENLASLARFYNTLDIDSQNHVPPLPKRWKGKNAKRDAATDAISYFMIRTFGMPRDPDVIRIIDTLFDQKDSMELQRVVSKRRNHQPR